MRPCVCLSLIGSSKDSTQKSRMTLILVCSHLASSEIRNIALVCRRTLSHLSSRSIAVKDVIAAVNLNPFGEVFDCFFKVASRKGCIPLGLQMIFG